MALPNKYQGVDFYHLTNQLYFGTDPITILPTLQTQLHIDTWVELTSEAILTEADNVIIKPIPNVGILTEASAIALVQKISHKLRAGRVVYVFADAVTTAGVIAYLVLAYITNQSWDELRLNVPVLTFAHCQRQQLKRLLSYQLIDGGPLSLSYTEEFYHDGEWYNNVHTCLAKVSESAFESELKRVLISRLNCKTVFKALKATDLHALGPTIPGELWAQIRLHH